MHTVASPTRLTCRDHKALRRTMDWVETAILADGDVTLDCSPLKAVDPVTMLLMHHYVGMKQAGKVLVKLPVAEVARNVIQVNLGKRGQLERRPTDFPLRSIPAQQDLIPVLAEWRELLMQSDDIDEAQARDFASTMAEVLTNSFAHGRNQHRCIVAGQSFPKSAHSLLAAIDDGVGIPTTLRDCGRYTSDGLIADHEWIRRSTDCGVTCKSVSSNRGFGLYQLRQMMHVNGGTMMIASGRGIYVMERGKESFCGALGRGRHLRGTLLVLDIDTRGANHA